MKNALPGARNAQGGNNRRTNGQGFSFPIKLCKIEQKLQNTDDQWQVF